MRAKERKKKRERKEVNDGEESERKKENGKSFEKKRNPGKEGIREKEGRKRRERKQERIDPIFKDLEDDIYFLASDHLFLLSFLSRNERERRERK